MGKKCLSLEWTIIIQTVTQNTTNYAFFSNRLSHSLSSYTKFLWLTALMKT